MTETEKFQLDVLERHVLCIYKMIDNINDILKTHSDALEVLLGIDPEEKAMPSLLHFI